MLCSSNAFIGIIKSRIYFYVISCVHKMGLAELLYQPGEREEVGLAVVAK